MFTVACRLALRVCGNRVQARPFWTPYQAGSVIYDRKIRESGDVCTPRKSKSVRARVRHLKTDPDKLIINLDGCIDGKTCARASVVLCTA